MERAFGEWVWFKGHPQPFLDLVMSHGAVPFGHCHPRLVEALKREAELVDNNYPFPNKNQVELAERLLSVAPLEQDEYEVLINISGSFVVDKAIELSRIVTGKAAIASFDKAFHGSTLSLLPATDACFVDHSELMTEASIKIPFCEESRCPQGSPSSRTCGCLETSERIIKANQSSLAALLVEPIQGSAGNILPASGYLRAIQEICERHNVLFVVDDLQVGLGRTGRVFSIENFGVENPDIIVTHKGLGGGFYPLVALIARKSIFSAVSRNPLNATVFGGAFLNNAFGCGIALEVLDILLADGVLERVKENGDYFLLGLQNLFSNHPLISRAYGLGYVIGMELTSPDEECLSRADIAREIIAEGMRQHVILYSRGGDGERIKLSPSLTMDRAVIDIALEKIRGVVATASESLLLQSVSRPIGGRNRDGTRGLAFAGSS